MIRFKLEGETPAKKNSKQVFAKGGKVIVTTSQRYKEWYTIATKQIQEQKKLYKDCLPLTGNLYVTINFYHADNRRRDSDNGLSSVLDLLVEQGILVDDRWQIVRKLKVTNEKSDTSFCIISVDNI